MSSVNQLFCRVLTIGAASLIIAVMGCRSDDNSPVGPDAAPALTSASAATSLAFIQISGARPVGVPHEPYEA